MLAALARATPKAEVTWREISDTIGARSRSDAGVVVTPDRAISVSTVYRGILVLANAIASIPLLVNRRLDDDGKERAPDHPQYAILHDRPNPWMTSQVWRRMLVRQRILHGNHYSEILPLRGGAFELRPLDPRVTRVIRLTSEGKKVFETRDVLPSGGYGSKRTLHQDEVLHVMNEMTDEQGLMGIGLMDVARNALGLTLAGERHGSQFLKQGARLAGIASAPGRMDEEQRKINEAALNRSYGGVNATGSIALVTGGLKFDAVTASNKDSQWLELRAFQVEDMLRFLGVPGVLCNYADKTATYASAEQFFLSNVVYGIDPLAIDIASELNKSVVTGVPEFFAEFKLEGLLRGDIRTRYGAHQVAIQSGFMTRNEIRVIEGLNKGPDELNEFLEPVAIAQMPDDDTDPAPPRGAAPADDDNEEDARAARFRAIAERSVGRLVRRELSAIAGTPTKKGAAKRFAGDAVGWVSWLDQFYADHAAVVAEDLDVAPEVAAGYCDSQRALLAAGIPANFELASMASLLALLES